MAHLIEVAFRGNRKEFFSWDGETPPALRAGIIVEADRGEDFGRVHSTGELAEVRCNGCAHGCGTTPPALKALRLATKDDERSDGALTEDNERCRREAIARVKANGLVMKLTDAEWQWDRRKLTFYFTAERRVDFRNLVRDLAALFKARIELKQIGVRDEAKRLSGVGRCGREYCSSSWLPELLPVNLGVAKDQKLSLNPQQISGACGRLMCCLRYEHEFYVQSRRKFPKEGKILVTSLGEEKVVSCDIFNERVTLRTAEGDSRVITLVELRTEVERAGDPTTSVTETFAIGDFSMEITAEMPVASDLLLDETPVRVAEAPRAPAAIMPVVEVVPAELPAGAPEFPGAPAESVEAEADAETDAASGDEPRRKRRRGRRGGRRLRAAELRRGGDGTDGTDDAENLEDAADEEDVAPDGSDADAS